MFKAVWGHGEIYPRSVTFPCQAAPMTFEESVTLEMLRLLNTQLASSRASPRKLETAVKMAQG